VADLYPEPFLPKFDEINEVTAFDEVAFRLEKEFFTGPSPYLSNRTATAARFWMIGQQNY
jgi:hypothetical protein